MNLKRTIGFPHDSSESNRLRMLRYINLQLLANGLPGVPGGEDAEFVEISRGLLDNHHEKTRLLADHRCPADARIEAFLTRHFAEVTADVGRLRLPGHTLVLDRHGMARELALPSGKDEFRSEFVESYRVFNGVIHNPRSDRRTTSGTFHVADGGLPVADDKKIVPKLTFAKLLQRAVTPPDELLVLPFTGEKAEPAKCFVSLLLRPVVCPEVPGFTPEKTMETRFFAPGSLVSNLDFVESIFGNAGDPDLPANDAGLDVLHWSGHTGCVILAPHLVRVTKSEVGLPHWDDATERQRRDEMCWREEGELYNGGGAFKITCRSEEGVIVTIISDNYFGYCKKEVKTQLSYAANLFGACEEEHAGGALAFASFNLGDEFQVLSRPLNNRTFTDVAVDYQDDIDVQPEGYGIDKRFPDLIYIPDESVASLRTQTISWEKRGVRQEIPLLPDKIYMAPSGLKLRMEKHPGAPSWRVVGTAAEGAVCHKPCTVSGGGKSEISKSIRDYMLYGPIVVTDLEADLERAGEIFTKDYSTRWKPGSAQREIYKTRPTRPLLPPERSLGSVIKLLTPSTDYTDEFNQWLNSIPNHLYAIVLIIKRFYSPDWGDDWRRHFSVDIMNGELGHELKFDGRKLVGTYLRVGLTGENTWRTFKVRQDFLAAAKVQTEDDISASTVVPGRLLAGRNGSLREDSSYKFVLNCEYRLFQRPDDAIHRGLDKQTELDFSKRGNFFSNYEPLGSSRVAGIARRVVEFDKFTEPMQRMLREALESGASYTACSSEPRIVDGKRTRNPRYLQDRPDLVRPLDRYVAERGLRLFRGIPSGKPVYIPVDSVLFGRRNNPPDTKAGIRGLAVYGPIHYQEPPELFMDLIVSLTGKSPSTTGFGSEGALTKAPFNALFFTADLNAALVSYILTGLAAYSTPAGHIGPNVEVGHDLSLLIPEIWCRLSSGERDPAFLIGEGLLEQTPDLEFEGRNVPAGRLGYRITYEFVRRFFGRVFDNPDKVFDESILRPETQDRQAFCEGVEYIVEAQRQTAARYFADGSIEQACPPLRALLTIMAEGSFEGKTERDPGIRAMFTRESLLASGWYRERLETKQRRDIELWKRHAGYVRAFRETLGNHGEAAPNLLLDARLRLAEEQLERVSAAAYLDELVGTLGADPLGLSRD